MNYKHKRFVKRRIKAMSNTIPISSPFPLTLMIALGSLFIWGYLPWTIITGWRAEIVQRLVRDIPYQARIPWVLGLTAAAVGTYVLLLLVCRLIVLCDPEKYEDGNF